jgi:hypothetical protein
MAVKICIPPELRSYTKNLAVVEVNGHTIGECLQELFRQYLELQQTVPPTGFQIYKANVADEPIFSWDSDRPVRDGEELVLSFISGCC